MRQWESRCTVYSTVCTVYSAGPVCQVSDIWDQLWDSSRHGSRHPALHFILVWRVPSKLLDCKQWWFVSVSDVVIRECPRHQCCYQEDVWSRRWSWSLWSSSSQETLFSQTPNQGEEASSCGEETVSRHSPRHCLQVCRQNCPISANWGEISPDTGACPGETRVLGLPSRWARHQDVLQPQWQLQQRHGVPELSLLPGSPTAGAGGCQWSSPSWWVDSVFTVDTHHNTSHHKTQNHSDLCLVKTWLVQLQHVQHKQQQNILSSQGFNRWGWWSLSWSTFIISNTISFNYSIIQLLKSGVEWDIELLYKWMHHKIMLFNSNDSSTSRGW